MYIDWQKINSVISLKDIKQSYLFSEQFEKIKSICDEIVNKSEESFYDESIIGIAGERGSGKR